MKIIFLITSLITSLAIGFFTAIYTFAIDTDLLGIPYSNTPVVFNQSRVINQNGNMITLPAGTKLTYKYTSKSIPIYSLDIVGGFGEIPPKSKDKTRGYFFVETSE